MIFEGVIISFRIYFDINFGSCSGGFIAVGAYEFQVAFLKVSISAGNDIIEKVWKGIIFTHSY